MFEKIKKFLNPDEVKEKKGQHNIFMYLSMIAMVGVLLMLFSNSDSVSPSQLRTSVANPESQPVFKKDTLPLSYEERQEARLENVLSLVEGVGKIEVTITLQQGKEYLYSYNTSTSNSETEESDSAGGRRYINDSSESKDVVIIRDENGAEIALLRTEMAPVIQGVVVVAEGAADSRISANLARAVQTVLGVPLYKICVLPYKR